MANDLTGDFDVVAQFAIPAANRVLAAMHRVERFQHSVAIRVDDSNTPGPRGIEPSIVVAVDGFGDTIADHHRIKNLRPLSELPGFTSVLNFVLDPVMNLGNTAVIDIPPLEPSNLQGRAQLQLFPPTIDVTDGSGTNVTVRIKVLARYFPDPNTSPMAEFVRGELRITAPVTQVASQVANVIEIDIKAANVKVSFVAHSSSRPLSAADMAAINLLIRNALKTSFLPSNSTLPSNIRHMQFKTLQGARNAIAVLLDLEGSGRGNRNSVSNIFLGGGDDFAVGVGVDFVRAAFQPTIDTILSTPVDPISVPWPGENPTYTVVLRTASVDLRSGEIVFTITGRATTRDWPPNFNFTATLRFSLRASRATARLVPGDVSIDTSSWIINRFRGRAISAIRTARDRALAQSNARATVRRMLSADENLGGFLNSLLAPALPTPGQPPQRFRLTYSGVEIRPSGIVLHGSLAAGNSPAARAEFQQIPANSNDPLVEAPGINRGPDYSAFKSWIPGGTIKRYEWKPQGQSGPGFSDENTFVFTKPSPGSSTGILAATLVSGYVPLCLTVHGTRLSSSGPVVARSVTATVCGVNSFPLFDATILGDLPLIALARPDRRGMVRVAGHTLARKAQSGRVPSNLIVQFGDRDAAAKLEVLLQGLRESGRGDASAAVVAVLSPADLQNARYTEGITYAEDQDGLWERRFGLRVTRRPLTVLVAPDGKVVWQHEGAVDAEALATALRKYLVAGERVEPSLRAPVVRIGQPPPNFLFEYVPGRELTLRKIAGRPVILVFWRSSSKQSIEAVGDLAQKYPGGEGPLVLAINDGEDADLARSLAAGYRSSAIVVTDAARSISLAYGVNTWPTVVSIDALGLVAAIHHGRSEDDSDEPSFEQTTSRSIAP